MQYLILNQAITLEKRTGHLEENASQRKKEVLEKIKPS